MEITEETLEQYLPAIEEFLTSILLEETDIEITEKGTAEKQQPDRLLNETDVFLFSRDQNRELDVILALDNDWLGLLSRNMLGEEINEKNEQTEDLLKEFWDDLEDTLREEADSHDLEYELDGGEVLTRKEAIQKLNHDEYFRARLEISEADGEDIKAEFMLGDPEAVSEDGQEQEKDAQDDAQQETAEQRKKNEQENQAEQEEQQDQKDGESADELSGMEEDGDEFSSIDAHSGEEEEGQKEKVISARHIEFAEFSEDDKEIDGEMHSMDLIKDVELDISVELGRIQLPLGKVLQLSKGSVIELEKLAGEPVDILVNGNRIALGEVVVIDEHFGVRISSLVTTKKRLAKIKNGS